MSQSKHSPILAGGVVSVTGTALVDTGLRELLSFAATLKADAMTANEESHVAYEPQAKASDNETVKVLLSVFKGGTAHGTAGDSAVDVGWMAVGE